MRSESQKDRTTGQGREREGKEREGMGREGLCWAVLGRRGAAGESKGERKR